MDIRLSQTQQQKQKFQPCRNGCGIQICFDAQKGRTPSGGWIPMQTDSVGQLVKHECPKKPQQKQQASPTPAPAQEQQRQQQSRPQDIAEIKALQQQILQRLDYIQSLLLQSTKK